KIREGWKRHYLMFERMTAEDLALAIESASIDELLQTAALLDRIGGECAKLCDIFAHEADARLDVELRVHASRWTDFQKYGVTGFPNHFFNESWVVGLWRTDHADQDDRRRLGDRARTACRSRRGDKGRDDRK